MNLSKTIPRINVHGERLLVFKKILTGEQCVLIMSAVYQQRFKILFVFLP
ncbi:MAG: hypothetical protein Ct9H300mP23_08370 [Nitrospinota bacterium]|nr:MAG: hypothetical protein Ct9H300mP23_08370 [Nitrospinota bacterium]